jgi:protein transport protein SEC31
MNNLLASGAGDSEVIITDLKDPKNPSVYSPGAKTAGPTSDISCVAWNRKVSHILASTSHNGQSVVWDLRMKRPVTSFTDPASKGGRSSVIEWHPELPTRVMIASEDDRSPTLQVWDLRNAFAPLTELRGHHKGILSASWCPHDQNLLISCGKDNRTICWDPETATALCELPSAGNWTFDVRWSPSMVGLVSCASFDGEVSLYSLQDAGVTVTADGFQEVTMRPPKWLQRPCGVSLGFGGTVAWFNDRGIVSTNRVVTDQSLVERSKQLSAALESRALQEYCAAKAAATSSDRDAAEWSLMQVLCSSDQRRLLLSYLGLAEPTSHMPLRSADDANVDHGAAEAVSQAAGTAAVLHDAVDAADLFSQMAIATAAAKEAAAREAALQVEAVQQAAVRDAAQEVAGRNASKAGAAAGVNAGAAILSASPMHPAMEKKLSLAMLNGNFGGAVECCLQAGRVADALVLAASGGPELWTATRDRFLQSSSTPFGRTLAAVVHQDFNRYVEEADLAQWKETLALLNTYASPDELSTLCNQLGDRLEANPAAATLCYMCAANIERTVKLWEMYYNAPSSESGETSALLDMMEKLAVFQDAAQTRDGFALVAAKVTQFAEMLAAQGCSYQALQHVLALPAHDMDAAALCDRIYGQNAGFLTAPPPPPYQTQPIQPSQDIYLQRGAPQQQTPQLVQQPHPGASEYEPFDRNLPPASEVYLSASTAAPTPYPLPAPTPGPYPQPGSSVVPSMGVQMPPMLPLPRGPPASMRAPTGTLPVNSWHSQPAATPASNGYITHPPSQQQNSQPPSSQLPPSQLPSQLPSSQLPPSQLPLSQPQHTSQPSPSYQPSQRPAHSTPYAYQATPPARALAPPAYSHQPTAEAYVGHAALPTADHVDPACAERSTVSSSVPEVKGLSYDHETTIQSLTALAKACAAYNLPPLEQRKLDDVTRRLGSLSDKLRQGGVSPVVFERLQQLCGFLAIGDAANALEMHVQITTSDWADNGAWLMGVKRLIEMTSKLGVRL